LTSAAAAAVSHGTLTYLTTTKLSQQIINEKQHPTVGASDFCSV